MNNGSIRMAVLCAMMGLPLATPVLAAGAESLTEMVTKGSAALDLRYRYEYVSQDGVADNAHASTLRSRLTLGSASYRGFSGLVEVDDVTRLGAEQYRTPANGETRYPIVADPTGTGLNQAWLRYSEEDFSLTAGRQRIQHGSQRFIGGVAWRQNEQTFDSVRLQLPAVGPVAVDYSYIWDVDRIFAPDISAVQPRRFDSDSHAMRASWSPAEGHQLAGFGYLLDFDNAPAASSQTYGVEYQGKLGPVALTASYAEQSDYGDNATDYRADYYLAEVSVPVKPVTLAAGVEVLGSDNGVASFQTPLATGHKFQGWADIFLATPASGIKDAYIKVAGKAGPAKLALFYHDFVAEEGSAEYGSEWNVVATVPYGKHLSAQLKYANYQAQDFAADTEKVWLTLNFKY